MKILVNKDLKQINWLDERFYTDDDPLSPDARFEPSTTEYLSIYPKGYGYNQWLKDLGSNADQVLERAGNIGSKVHDAINRLLKEEVIIWDDKTYSLEEWKYILRFKEFWGKYKPELLATEWGGVSHNLRLGGTLDLICKFNDEVWLIDFKTSNAIYNSYELQIAAYRELWNEIVPEYKIQRAGIFWFKALTRGEDKKGKSIQGKNWQLKEYTRDHKEAFELFKAIQKIWHNENPNPKPKNLVYPTEIKL